MAVRYKMDDGVPLPRRGMFSNVPVAMMEIGRSFFIPNGKATTIKCYAASRWPKMCPGRKFRARAVEGGIRVWRVA